MKTPLTRLYVARLAGLVLFVGLFTIADSYGQGTIGFSSQTQPALLRGTETVKKSDYVRWEKLPSTSQFGQVKTYLPIQNSFFNPVPDTALSIAEASIFLQTFDELRTKSGARHGLGKWLIGIVSDGDFNKPITGTVSAGKAGSLGIDAVFMKDVYTHYTYYFHNHDYVPDKDDRGHEWSEEKKVLLIRKNSDSLDAWQHVSRPRVALNTLVVLFSGATPLATGATKSTTGWAPATLDQQRIFGQALLIPNGYVAGSGLSFSTNLTYYFGRFGPKNGEVNGLSESGRWGMSASLVAVQTNWSSRDTMTAVNILAPSLGLVYRAVEGHVKVGDKDNYAQIQPFIRYTMRHLFGDVEAGSGLRMLRDAVGTDQRTYHAADIGITLSINAVRLTTNVPIFFGKKIEGFSRGQIIAGFGLAASIPISN